MICYKFYYTTKINFIKIVINFIISDINLKYQASYKILEYKNFMKIIYI